jgi:NTE family protein
MSNAQSVGLVLSGGAAKGLAHIGVIKALEENEVPIDFITGTSMGAIIGSAYASGMSAADIETLFTSAAFQNWVGGKADQDFRVYYQDVNNTPSLVRINLAVDSTLNFAFQRNIASDVAINFALAEFLSQPSAIAEYDFDKLFVPLRLVAADIFSQRQVILSKGLLNDAVRASQSVPFFYSPIKVDGKYLFDGGIYNNFPVDVAIAEFNPDVIIGVNVSTKIFDTYPYDLDDRLVGSELFLMMIDKADPSKIPEGSFYIEPDLRLYSGFDFKSVRQLIDSGYQATIRQIHEIKDRISRTVSCDELSEKRNSFNAQRKPYVFNQINYQGFSKKQQRYINNLYGVKKKELTLHDIKTGYFKLVSEDYFKSIYPGIIYNEEAKAFDFTLSQRPGNNLKVDFGGNLSTRNISNMFLGLNFYYFSNFFLHAYTDFYAGNFYKSATVKLRLDFPYFGRFYLEPEFVFNDWDYLEADDVLFTDRDPTGLRRIDRKSGINLGQSVGNKYKIIYSLHGLSNVDRFVNTPSLSSLDTLDNLRLGGIRTGLSLMSYSLNRKQYASSGKSYQFSLSYFDVNEKYFPGSTSFFTNELSNRHKWFRAHLKMEQYFNKGPYSWGYLLEGVASNQPVFSNYKASIISAPGFYPIQDSRTLFLENFRAYSFAALGLRNVYELRKSLDLRAEAYVFRPVESIRQGPEQRAILISSEKDFFFAGTAGIVYHSALGPLSLSVNYYDDRENKLGVLLHVGFLLFNKTSLD